MRYGIMFALSRYIGAEIALAGRRRNPTLDKPWGKMSKSEKQESAIVFILTFLILSIIFLCLGVPWYFSAIFGFPSVLFLVMLAVFRDLDKAYLWTVAAILGGAAVAVLFAAMVALFGSAAYWGAMLMGVAMILHGLFAPARVKTEPAPAPDTPATSATIARLSALYSTFRPL